MRAGASAGLLYPKERARKKTRIKKAPEKLKKAKRIDDCKFPVNIPDIS